jgi:hypothetical protein
MTPSTNGVHIPTDGQEAARQWALWVLCRVGGILSASTRISAVR